MSMIQCEECGANISDRAKACPYCGCPIVDDFDVGYEYEEGARQSRQDQAEENAFRYRKSKFMWFMICILTFFVSYGIGHSLFPKAVHGGGSFVPIALAILSGVCLFIALTMGLMKRIFLGFLPHAFLTYMILASFSGGYLIGSIMGM